MAKKTKKPNTKKSKKDPVFQHVMDGVDPLPSDQVPPHELMADIAPAAVAPDAKKPTKTRKQVVISPQPPSPPPPPPPSKPMTHGDTKRMDKRTGQKFVGGRMDIGARLDLHGMTEPQAHGALFHFIESCWERQLRCVLVVTGKGLQSESGVGVLRSAVPRWLNEPDLRPRVLSFSHAQPKDGGEGALYVLLKRQR